MKIVLMIALSPKCFKGSPEIDWKRVLSNLTNLTCGFFINGEICYITQSVCYKYVLYHYISRLRLHFSSNSLPLASFSPHSDASLPHKPPLTPHSHPSLPLSPLKLSLLQVTPCHALPPFSRWCVRQVCSVSCTPPQPQCMAHPSTSQLTRTTPQA